MQNKCVGCRYGDLTVFMLNFRAGIQQHSFWEEYNIVSKKHTVMTEIQIKNLRMHANSFTNAIFFV